MPNDFEKEFDDEVYEDDFYEETFDDEEILEEEMLEDDLIEEDEVEEDEKQIAVILACDDCDYRWEDVIVKHKDEDIEDLEIICPMCGSTNITQI
ncbi:MAG TPA: hypothetical protein PL059_08700 [Spirochaetota bacterium]|nr:hypothetical protein [Spirochaetota bacterium]HOJ29142.1 hypothetical protein [Spirochaetota bacterium]HPP49797.1 hypothetical protein [Spirochaetota bacterium]HXK66010.1 hypothetical protein [Spirochaetota bacterium]